MKDKKELLKGVEITPSNTTELVAIASKAQSLKLKEVLKRVDVIKSLDKDSLNNVTKVLSAAKADGGCGIGCW